jgi:hypothetical protein
MKVFAQLIDALLLSRFEREKQKVWADFIQNNSENESYVGLVTSLLKNESPKRIILAKNLKVLALETVGVPHWLLDESKHFVGNMSETIALILAPLQTENNIEVSLEEVIEGMKSFQLSEAFEIQEWVVSYWGNMGSREVQVFNKLVTGSFRSPFNLPIFSNSEIQKQPIALKLVLLYAERGRVDGRTRFTEFTMGIASGKSWLTFTKVAVQIPQLEYEILERWIMENTQEKFGPVHRLPATQVFTEECIEIALSKRHKSGYRVTKAKLKTWENGLPLDQVATIESIEEILSQYNLCIA